MKLAALDTYEAIGVVGLGQTGLSCVRYLLQRDIAPIIFDTRAEPPGLKELAELHAELEIHTGPLQLEHILAMDLLIVSPGVDLRTPALQLASDAAIPVIGDMDLFARHANKPVLGITGSNGKSTVTRLVTDLLTAAGKKVAMGGNIGVPVLDLVGQPADVFVLELSSFQLELMHDLHLRGGTILNISDDHMDRYSDLRDYSNAKHRIYNRVDVAIWNREQEMTAPSLVPLNAQLTFGLSPSSEHGPDQFGLTEEDGEFAISFAGEPLLKASELQLTGVHNLLNVQAALALVYAYGVDPHEILDAARNFKGLPHRCELVGEYQQVQWVNDSKATNIGAAEAAIFGTRQLVKGKLILIAGGDGKGADFAHFRAALKQVDVVIVLGKDGERIANQVEHAVRVKTLEEAVATAAELATPNSMVLLSPACASLDMFKNYEQRGEKFRAAVEAHYGRKSA
ncbi:UDP-N-acetylmuramoyl-L-alanine--D-glutamate ligase [Pseudidiomarina andamanensis]|uniref:UDP-N-acetylmuramoylalanine--D-glutamate ligase n=1 Tax=Pseudidiomarina andamanensis TaxID=1940690 RepID=A0AA92EUV9_9GAMM|nr:UDP-N-acetylmuramoyl-L-alanine--D-glutamate ligase [Pseudidiomarina andamanensis]MDS0217602.1 UDP-N-acetylmuramoyl-L-alanine--D-glutamate ligase [Pseudidiomarina andamanensis]QGT96596.1 UDP-N-acetylmuramoyl-L-alanine--D-glutamate ligase [Pseudidiomarina andamanensis]